MEVPLQMGTKKKKKQPKVGGLWYQPACPAASDVGEEKVKRETFFFFLIVIQGRVSLYSGNLLANEE